VDGLARGLEDGRVAVREVVDHDLRVEFFDGRVDEGTGAHGEFRFVADERLSLLDA